MDAPKAALNVFNLNAEIHLASSNAYDSLGEAYFTLGDYIRAILNYKKSLELDPKNDNARKMLERIEKNKWGYKSFTSEQVPQGTPTPAEES